MAAPGDDVELGAVDLGDHVASHQLDRVDPVVFASQDEQGDVDPVQIGGDVLDDGVRDPTTLGLFGAGEAVLDDLLAKLLAERRVPKDGVQGKR